MNINPHPLILFSNVSHGEILCACVPFYSSSPMWNKQTSTLKCRLGVIYFVTVWNPLAFPFSTPKAAVLKCWQIGLVCPSALGTSQFLMLWCVTTQLLGIDWPSHGDKAWAVSSWCLPLPWVWNKVTVIYNWRDNGRLEFFIFKTVFLLYLAIDVVLRII